MKSLIALFSLVWLAIVIINNDSIALEVNQKTNIESEKAKIKSLFEHLDKAIQTENIEEFSKAFTHDADLISIGPDVREKAFGWEALKYIQSFQFKDLESFVILPEEMEIKIDDSGKLARYFRVFDLKFTTNNLTFGVEDVRETGVLEKQNGKWVITQQHVSAPLTDSVWPFYIAKEPDKPTAYNINNKFSVIALKEDYDLLRLALEEAHAGMYRYTNKSEFNKLFDDLFIKLNQPMTELEFFRFISPLIQKIHCGHTELTPSSSYQDFVHANGKFFPFESKFIAGKAFVLSSYSSQNQIPPGSEIVSINNRKMKDILSAFIRMLPTDGNNQTFIYRTLDRYFPERYHLYIEQPDNFRIEYKSPGKGKINKITVSGVCLDTIYQNMPTFEDLYKEPLKFEILGGSNIAVLTIKTFISKFLEHFGFDLDEFLAFAFKKIQKDNVENLIIDLRWNDGGDLGSELLAYLIDKPIRFFKRIDTPRTRYSFLEHTDKGVFFNSFHTTLWEKARDNTGRYLLSGDWSRFIEPKSTLFKGNVYILINGMSVSGTSDIAVVTHYYKRAIFIGEETGGAYYGNNAGDYLKLTLPNTKIRVKIPIRRYIMAVSDYPYPDRGVIPDFEIKPTIEDILNQIDTELEYTIKLIRTK